MEGFEFKGAQSELEPEKSTNLEKVKYAFEHLGSEGTRVRDSIYEITIDRDQFRERVRTFNNLSAEERGGTMYDHNRSLAERAETPTVVQEIGTGRNGPITVMLDADGALLLSVSPDN